MSAPHYFNFGAPILGLAKRPSLQDDHPELEEEPDILVVGGGGGTGKSGVKNKVVREELWWAQERVAQVFGVLRWESSGMRCGESVLTFAYFCPSAILSHPAGRCGSVLAWPGSPAY